VAGERTCIVCEGHGPFIPTYARDGFTLVRCPGCGLVFQDPQPTDADLETTYYHDEEWTRMVLGPLREKLLERARQQLGFLDDAGVTPDGGALLDVGCSSGTFMELAAQAGWNTVGVELGETTAQAARDRGLDVRTGTLAAVADQFEAGSFSLVTFWDVLEHLRDPREELALARRLLAPGGILAATMPNVAGLYPQTTLRLIARPTGAWEYPELPVHLYDFAPRTTELLLRRNGFAGVRVRTYPTPFWYYRWTSLSLGALGGRFRGRALRAAFEALRGLLYPAARLTNRQNAQFVVARPLGPGQ
jgi:SAM-dependent methyltransferase